MAQDLERLVVQLSADIKGYENALNRAQGVTVKRFAAIQKSAETSNKAVAASFIRTGAQIGAAFLASSVVREAAQLSDAATRISNSLKVAGLSGEELEKVYQRLNKAALANGAPIETLATLYGKAAQAQRELGVSSEELLGFTNNVALALRVAGTDSQSASGALLQLGQALGSGTVHAEEFNSILEGAPTIAQAVAAGLLEAGGSVSKLKSLIVDGKVSSEAFFRAFEAGAPILQEKVAGSVFTIDQATTNLVTALTDVAKEFNESTGASESFAGGINTAAGAINDFDVSGLIEKIRSAKAEFEDFLGSLGNSDFFASLNEALGVTDGNGNVINLDASEAKDETASLEKEVATLQDRIALNTSLGFDNTEALARLGEVQQALANIRAAAANLPATVSVESLTAPAPAAPAAAGTGEQFGPPKPPEKFGPPKPVAVKPISTNDFKPPASSKGGGGGGRKKDGGSGENEYQREIEQIKERTAAIQAETTAQAGVNPLVEDYGFAIEKARAQSDLLTAAQKAGMTITPELKASIDQLATGYANASVAAERLQESQDRVKYAAADFKDTAKDITSGFISDLRNGSSAAEALSNALNKVLDKVIDIGLNAIFGGGGGGGGLLAGLGSLLGFADGGYTGPGGKNEPAGIVHKGEYVLDAETTKRIGVKNLRRLQGYASGGLVGAPAMPVIRGAASGGKQGGKTQIQVGVSVDDTGGLRAYVKSVSQDTVTAASPRILSAANQQVVPTMAKYQNDSAGGDYRNG
ncbi:tape measure domain-containing protein [Rhizobium binae]|uniref:Tape measure domain-containing protein n=1 Tax=Rhizobium binae TaxID=1138190 RepID=A0ABV2MH37_9HYPH|nr:tape measure protein [Rhizobium binae]MBX4992893.1 tape measure protein [Rhizobium binae]NKL47197.1 tape measure protein [Rhizobium leguminosarum bv. viciae]QSY84166.1 tape measure protein [Rhizobium binae]